MEEFNVEQHALQQFVEKNQELWKNFTDKKNEKYIFVHFFMITKDLAWMMPKLLYAKGLEQETGAKPVVIDWKFNRQMKELFDSYGIEYVTIHDKMWKQIPSFISAVFRTIKLLLLNISGEQLKEVEWKSIPVGMHLYEDFIRSSELSTIRTVRNKTVIKKLISMNMFMNFIYKLCRKKCPEIVVADDFPYNEGIAVAIEASFGARIVQMGTIKKEWMLSYGENQYSLYRHHYLHRYMEEHLLEIKSDDYLAWVENYLNDRFSGKNGVVIDRVAYTDKSVCSRDELVAKLGINPDKKNVIIMAHVFSDATFQSGNTPFRDNYDWTERTLQHIQNLDNVNWIIKLHPARNRYNDSMDSIEKLVEKYQSPNISVFPEEYSAESILSVADALVTICGTSGIEFTCFGIPAIIVGNAFYNGFGFTNHPENAQEYFDMLSTAEQLKPLEDSQKDMAKKILYIYGNLMERSLDVFDKRLSDVFYDRIAHGELDTEYQTRVLKMFDDELRKNHLTKLAYYRLGETFLERFSE